MPRITQSTIRHIESVADSLNIPSDDAWKLRKCALTLHRWYERECGDSTASGNSYCIERDEETCKPYMAVYPCSGKSYRYAIRDMERAAERRIADICKRNGLHWYLQTDCRGGTLYLSREPITEQTYSRATFIA